MTTHIVQSEIWGNFKKSYGTPVVKAGNAQYTKHKIPFTSKYYGYCPRVDPFVIDFEELKKSAVENDCININFDVPDVVSGTSEAEKAVKILGQQCDKAPRDQFAKGNVLLDISGSEENIMANMHKKHRYNIKYAQRNSVEVKMASNEKDFDIFYELFAETNERQKYYGRPRTYLKGAWETLSRGSNAFILTSYFKNEPLASWMFFNYEDVLYYPYGGSSEKHRNLFGSNLVAWEGILEGKLRGCKMFDMWGTAVDPDDKNDSYYGFTNFKMKFGGRHVVYIDSYDLVIDRARYNMFNTANQFRWKILKALR